MPLAEPPVQEDVGAAPSASARPASGKRFQKLQESSRSTVHLLLRLPFCLMFGALLAAEAAAYIGVRLTVLVLEYFLAQRGRHAREMHGRRRAAATYDEYHAVCKEIDVAEGRAEWRDDARSQHYDSALLMRMTERLRRLRTAGDAAELMNVLTFSRNFAGMLNLELYTKTWGGTKHAIAEYVMEVVACTNFLSGLPDAVDGGVDAAARRLFFTKARTEYGDTCLFLSGGGMLGLYHLGVVKALLENDVLPDLLSGTSAGAVVGSFVCTRSDAELRHALSDDARHELHQKFGPMGPFWGGRVYQFVKAASAGVMYDFQNFYNKLLWFTRDMTFAEAYATSGRVLNISCTPYKTDRVKRHPPVMLNHISAPDVPIAYAAMASSCVPFLMKPVVLMERVRVARDGSRSGGGVEYEKREDGTYVERTFLGSVEDHDDTIRMRDGSFESDLPTLYMARVFHAEFNIVSQVNPHLVPFFFNSTGEAGRPLRSWRQKGGWRGGFLLSFAEMWLKEDMRKNMKLLSAFRLLFDVFGVDWSTLFLQESMGEITITPPLRVYDYWSIGDNLQGGKKGRKDLDFRLRVSERNTWKAIPMLMSRMRIQHALTEAYAKHLTSSGGSASASGSSVGSEHAHTQHAASEKEATHPPAAEPTQP